MADWIYIEVEFKDGRTERIYYGHIQQILNLSKVVEDLLNGKKKSEQLLRLFK